MGTDFLMYMKWSGYNLLTVGCMSSSGLKTMNFQNMTKDNKEQKLSDSTNTAIAYSTCYVSLIFLNFFWGGIFYV